jgi:Zn-dependent protease
LLLSYLLFPDFSLWVLVAIFGALAVALTVHEFSHALVAYRLGDDTARRQGRLTLNPIAHLDLMGTILLLLVGFGWGKPVPVNHYRLRTDPKTGMALVALAGPGSNLALALALAMLWKVAGWSSLLMMDIIGVVIFYNVVLAIFNLIPIPPLDGFRVAVGVLPYPLARFYSRMELYGPAFLLVFIAFDWFIFSNIVGTSILGLIIRPFVNLFQHLAFSGAIPLISGMV